MIRELEKNPHFKKINTETKTNHLHATTVTEEGLRDEGRLRIGFER